MAAHHAGVQGVEAHAVDEVGRRLDVPHGQIAVQADGEPADPILATECACGFTGEAGDAFLHGHAEQGGGHVHRQQRAGQGRGAGVGIGGQRQWHTRRAQFGDRGQGGITGEIERTRQQHRHGAGAAHRGDAVAVEVFDMVGRQRTVTRRQGRTVLVAQLLGVDLDRQAVLLRGDEHLLGLRSTEGDVLAEHVHRFGQPGGGNGRNHDVADLVDVLLCLAARRDRMRAEEGRHGLDRALAAQLARDLQLFGLVGQGQPVPGFDLQRGDAFGQHGVQAGQAGGEQVGFAGGAGGAHGGDDAAAGTGDVGIAHALQALLELTGAVAGIDQVGVAVDQAGADPAPATVDALGRLQMIGRAGRADMHDAPIGRGDDAILDHAQAGAIDGDQVGVVPEGVTVHGSNHIGVYVYTI